jgi:cell division protein FtsB
MRHPVKTLLLVLLVLLQYRLWFGQDGSLPQLLQSQRAVRYQQQENEVLVERNALRAAEVEDLKSGLDALEERARSEMGMVKEGETFFQIIEEPDAVDSTGHGQ